MEALFVIPQRYEDLEQEKPNHVFVQDAAPADAEPGLVVSIAEDAVAALQDNNALHINDQACFDGFYGAIKHFAQLPARQRVSLVEALAGINVSCLVDSVGQLGVRSHRGDPLFQQHRNALQQYAFFLVYLARGAEEEAARALKEGGGAKAPAADKPAKAAAAKGRGRKGGASSQDPSASAAAGERWDWPAYREAVLHGLLQLVRVDAAQLFDAPHEQHPMLRLVLQRAIVTLEQPAAMKRDRTRQLVLDILCTVAVGHKLWSDVANQVMCAVMDSGKHGTEHLPELAGRLAKYSDEKYNCTQLTLAMLQQFVDRDPQAYDDDASKGNDKGVKQMAEVVACLAELQPRAVARNISLIMPYLACNTYAIRSSVVHVLASVVMEVLGRPDEAAGWEGGAGRGGPGSDTRGQASRLTTKAHCIAVLQQRILDKNAFTRKDVLKAWSALVESGALPIALLPKLVHSAHGRLDDSSVLVVKEALRLLQALVAHAPFGARLDARAMLASQRELEGRLQELVGQEDEEGEAEEGEDAWGGEVGEEVETEGQEGAEGAKGKRKKAKAQGWGTDAVQRVIKEEPGTEGEREGMEVDEDSGEGQGKDTQLPGDREDEVEEGGAEDRAGARARAEAAVAAMGASQTQAQGVDLGGGGGGGGGPGQGPLGALSSDVTTLRIMIATLKSGAQFARALLATLPEVRRCLSANGGNVDVIREAIALLAMCRKAGLAGGPEVRQASSSSAIAAAAAAGPSGGAKQRRGATATAAAAAAGGADVAEGELLVVDDSTEASLRSMWALVFSREPAVKEAVVDAVYNLYLAPGSGGGTAMTGAAGGAGGSGAGQAAKELIQLVNGATLGELSALDEIIRLLLGGGAGAAPGAGGDRPYLQKEVVAYVFRYLKHGHDACLAHATRQGSATADTTAGARPAPAADGTGGTASPGLDQQQKEQREKTLGVLRSSVTLLSLIACHAPRLVLDQAPLLLDVLRSALGPLRCAWTVRHCCLALKALAPLMHAAKGASQTAPVAAVLGRAVPLLCAVLLASSEGQAARGPGAAQAQGPGSVQAQRQGVQEGATGLLEAGTWFSAAEAAIDALYCLHPKPYRVMEAVLKQYASTVQVPASAAAAGSAATVAYGSGTGTGSPSSAETGVGTESVGGSKVSVQRLARFMFIIGHCALRQLAAVDGLARDVRRQRNVERLSKEEAKAAAGGVVGAAGAKAAGRKVGAGRKGKGAGGRKSKGEEVEDEEEEMEESEEEERAGQGGQAGAGADAGAEAGADLAAQVGMGSAAADAALDALKDAVERQILSDSHALLMVYAQVVQGVCRNMPLLQLNPLLRSSALLALSKLMAVDARFCEDNLQLFFTMLANRSLEPSIRCNLVVALGDLAVRFPNALEPWTSHMYAPLGDPDPRVRRRCVVVLSHLILSDMLKVKGHVAKLAMCMRAGEEPGIASLARAFFCTLAKKAHRASNPVYALLPDILSHLGAERELPLEDAEAIMDTLLQHIKQDKQHDALREKVCMRFEPVTEPRERSLLAACVKHLGYSDKGMRRVMELLACYKEALGQDEVYRVFQGLAVHARKHGDKKGDLKDLLVDYEAKVAEAHENLKEGGTRDQEEARGATQSGEGGEEVEDEGRQGQTDTVGAEEDAGQGHGKEADGMEVDEEQAGASAVPAAAAAAGAAASGARGANTGVAPEHGRKAVPVAAAAVVVKPEPGVGGAPKGPVAKTAAAAGGRAERNRARTTQVQGKAPVPSGRGRSKGRQAQADSSSDSGSDSGSEASDSSAESSEQEEEEEKVAKRGSQHRALGGKRGSKRQASQTVTPAVSRRKRRGGLEAGEEGGEGTRPKSAAVVAAAAKALEAHVQQQRRAGRGGRAKGKAQEEEEDEEEGSVDGGSGREEAAVASRDDLRRSVDQGQQGMGQGKGQHGRGSKAAGVMEAADGSAASELLESQGWRLQQLSLGEGARAKLKGKSRRLEQAGAAGGGPAGLVIKREPGADEGLEDW